MNAKVSQTIERVPVQCRVLYKNAHGNFFFEGATYRLVYNGKVVSTGTIDAKGLTKKVNAIPGTKLFIEFKNKYTGEWESPEQDRAVYITAKHNIPIYSVTVTNSYFMVKLVTKKNVPLNWRYRIFADIKGTKKTIASGTLKNGMSRYIDTETLTGHATGQASRNNHTRSNPFNSVTVSDRPNLIVEFIPSSGSPIIKSFKVIPVGADKTHRSYKLDLSTTKTIGFWTGRPQDSLTHDSLLQLREKKKQRRIILDIDLHKGASYTLERKDKGKLFFNFTPTKKVTFQDSKKTEVNVPKNYQGLVILKKGSKVIAEFSLEGLDPDKKNLPIVFCLSNKSVPAPFKKVSIEDIHKTEPMVWTFQAKPEDEDFLVSDVYDFYPNSGGTTATLKRIANSIFASLAFDGVALPSAAEAAVALQTNNRQFIMEAFKKLDIGGGKEGRLRFVVKKSKTGKTLINFKGFSGLRDFITASKYGAQHAKVSMIGSAASAASAAKTAGIGSAVKTTAKTAVRGSGIGFALVAVFDIAEWITSDDPYNNWSDLWSALALDLGKTAIAAAVGIAAGAAVVALSTVALPVIAVVAVGTLFAVGASFLLEWVDRKFEITASAQQYVNELGYY